MSSDLESNVVAIERIKEYSEIEPEVLLTHINYDPQFTMRNTTRKN